MSRRARNPVINGMKFCGLGCSPDPIPVERFSPRADGGYKAYCRACNAKYIKEYHIRNPRDRTGESQKPNVKAKELRRRLKRFGITHEQYVAMLIQQGYRCAICVTDMPGKIKGRPISWPIDHNHKTKKVRGLLCTRCNTAVGLLLEDPELARRLAIYLEVHNR